MDLKEFKKWKEDNMLTVPEVATICLVTERTVYYWLSGKIALPRIVKWDVTTWNETVGRKVTK